MAHHPTAKVVCITTYVLVSHAEPWKPQFCGAEPWDQEKKGEWMRSHGPAINGTAVGWVIFEQGSTTFSTFL